jgi:hypothetical protein
MKEETRFIMAAGWAVAVVPAVTVWVVAVWVAAAAQMVAVRAAAAAPVVAVWAVVICNKKAHSRN